MRSTKSLPKNATVDARPSKSSCTDNITPSCLQSLYGIPSTPASGSGSQLAVSGFINQFANQNDLKVCFESYLMHFLTLMLHQTDFPRDLPSRHVIVHHLQPRDDRRWFQLSGRSPSWRRGCMYLSSKYSRNYSINHSYRTLTFNTLSVSPPMFL